jgi:hypothetical protein
MAGETVPRQHRPDIAIKIHYRSHCQLAKANRSRKTDY